MGGGQNPSVGGGGGGEGGGGGPCPPPTYIVKKGPVNTLKQHAFESYFSIWIISHSSQDRNQPKVNYEDRAKSFLPDGNCESQRVQWKKLLHS